MNTFWIICFMIVMIIITYLFNIEKDNMIKYFKYFLTLFVISLWIINFSSSYYSVWSSTSTCVRNNNGYFTDLSCENNCTISSDMSFSCSSSNSKIIYTNYANWHQTAYYRTPNWLARYYVQNQWNLTCWTTDYSNWINQYLFTWFQLCEWEYYPNSSPNNPTCPWSWQILSYFEMLNYVKSHWWLIAYDFTFYHWNASDFGLSFIWNGYYFQSVLGWSSSVPAYWNVNNNPYWWIASPYNLNVSSSCSTWDYKVLLDTSFSNVVSKPMRLAGWNYYNPWEVTYNTWEKKSDLDNYIDYYEYRYNWNEKMCYVWTNDLEHSFRYFIWQSVPYEYWTGATLYQLYYSIYSWFGSNKVRNLWSFINSWLINYANVYVNVSEDDNRYIAQYNGPDTNVTILYTWYTNELFLGNLGAIYNMASVLYNSFSYESTMWEEIAFYCDMKLNYNSYNNWSLSFTWLVDLVTPWIVERIGDYLYYDMPWSTWFVSPVLWSWSIWNDIISSWYNIPDDVNPTNLFKDYFEKINDLIRNFSPISDWIIPDWILFPMLFLIFYRIIRH